MGQSMVWLVIWTCGIGGMWLAIRSSTDRAATREMHKVASHLGLRPPGGEGGEVLTRFRSRRLGQGAGIALGMVPVALSTVTMLLLGRDSTPSPWWIMAIPVGSALGAAIGVLRPTPTVPAGPRVASLAPRELHGYVPPSERWATRLTAVPMVLALAVVVWRLAVDGGRGAGTWLLLVLVLVSLAVWTWLGRLSGQVPDQPAPAGGREAVAWHEALRMLAVRDVLSSQLVVGLFAGVMPVVAAILDGWPDVQDALTGAGLVLCASAVLLLVTSVVVQLADLRLTWFRRHAGRDVLA